jgi:hypothetical protein
VARWWNGQEVALTGPSLAEAYSVLTRLPGDARLAPADAARLLKARFAAPLLLSGPRTRKLPDTLSRLSAAPQAPRCGVDDPAVAQAAGGEVMCAHAGAELQRVDFRPWQWRLGQPGGEGGDRYPACWARPGGWGGPSCA